MRTALALAADPSDSASPLSGGKLAPPSSDRSHLQASCARSPCPRCPGHRPSQRLQQPVGVSTGRAFRAILLVDRARKGRRRERMNATTNATMKAIVYPRYGSPDVLQLMEVEKPVPKDDQVLVRVHAASLNAYDRVVRGRPLLIRLFTRNGLRRPKDRRLGGNLAGRVEAVGAAVTRFRAA